MHIVHKMALWFASATLRSMLLLLATVTAVVVIFGNPTHIKTILKNSNVYSSAVDTVLEQAKKGTPESSSNDIPINDPAIQQAAKTAFSPKFLETSTEQIIDGTYGWLDGDTEKPEFKVDVGTAKQSFIKSLADYAENRVKGLPVCTNQQLAQLQSTEINPFTLSCKPANYNIASQKQTLINELSANDKFFPNATITADNLPKDEQGKTVYNHLEEAKKGYQFSKSSPYIIGILALLSGTAVLFLHSDRRKGTRSLATSFLSVGLVLGGVSLLLAWGLNKLLGPTGSLGKTLQSNTFQKSIADAVESLAKLFTNKLLVFAVVYVVIGTVVLCILKFWWKDENKAEQQTKSPEPPVKPTN